MRVLLDRAAKHKIDLETSIAQLAKSQVQDDAKSLQEAISSAKSLEPFQAPGDEIGKSINLIAEELQDAEKALAAWKHLTEVKVKLTHALESGISTLSLSKLIQVEKTFCSSFSCLPQMES